jgi:hypothetical protein
MKQQISDTAGDEQESVSGERSSHSTGIVLRSAGGKVVALDATRRVADGPPWELLEGYLQSGRGEGRVDDWQRRSPALASTLRVLRSLDSHAGEPSPRAALSSRRAPSWLLRPPPARQDNDR